MTDRAIAEGVLGCPTCGAEYPVRDGVAIFGAGTTVARNYSIPPSMDRALRVAGLLSLGTQSPGGVLLAGEWAVHADLILQLVRVPLYLVDAAPALAGDAPVARLVVDDSLPLSAGSLRGAAFDQGAASPGRLADAVRALRPGGRLIAPASLRVPPGMTELARDEDDWLAERDPLPSAHVVLGRARAAQE